MARGSVGRNEAGWFIRFDTGEDPVSGKRKQRYRGGFSDQRQAEAALALALSSVITGTHVTPRAETFGQVAAAWLEQVQVRATSENRYATVVHDHLIPALGHRKVQAVTAAHIRAFYRDCIDAGLATATIRAFHARLVQIYGYAVQERIAPSSIMAEVKPPKLAPSEFAVWSVEELRAFLRLTADEPYGRLWHVAGMTGMRRGELLGLRWRDVDLPHASIDVRMQAIAEGGGIQLRGLKTSRSKRSISLDAGTVAALHAQRGVVTSARMRFRRTWEDHDLVFPYLPRRGCPTPPGAPVRPSTASTYWCWRVQATALPQIRLHDVRHTHATHLLLAGTPAHVVAARLGHTVAMLFRVYAHSMPGQQDAVVAWLEMAYS